MPTVFRSGKYRFFFFSNGGHEPPHLHVESGGQYAKFWLEPVELSRSIGYSGHELNEIRKQVFANRRILKEKWDEFFAREG